MAFDHGYWHGSEAAYHAAKVNIVRYQRPDDIAVLNSLDERRKDFEKHTRARILYYGGEGSTPMPLLLPGKHNQLNAQAALTAAIALGVKRDQAERAAGAFAGLPHRLQLVHESRGVRYYNDSIATIPESAVAALESFPHKTVIQIIGGSEHGLPITALCNALIRDAKAVLCIGQTGDRVHEVLSENSISFAAFAYKCGDLATAMRMAKENAVPGDVVLLSTGYKSFDQFTNFEQRGAAFTALAREPG